MGLPGRSPRRSPLQMGARRDALDDIGGRLAKTERLPLGHRGRPARSTARRAFHAARIALNASTRVRGAPPARQLNGRYERSRRSSRSTARTSRSTPRWAPTATLALDSPRIVLDASTGTQGDRRARCLDRPPHAVYSKRRRRLWTAWADLTSRECSARVCALRSRGRTRPSVR